MTDAQEKAKEEYLEVLGYNGDGGGMIAVCSPATSILEEKAFDGKTILEIEDDMTDCILR